VGDRVLCRRARETLLWVELVRTHTDREASVMWAMWRYAVSVLVLSGLLPTFAQAADTAQQTIEKLDDAIFDAAKRGDADAFGQSLADDYVRIGADGKMYDKSSAVDLIDPGG
jgi:uncharacterized protein DUF4440